MNQGRLFGTILLLVFTVLVQCSKSTEPVKSQSNRLPTDLTAAERQLVASTEEFGFELFQRVTAEEPVDKNVFISPLSAAYALAMAYNGAAGETRDSISSVLALSGLTQQEINKSFAGLTDVLTGIDSNVTTKIANAVWYSPNFTVVPEFQTNCERYFNATVSALDFGQSWAADTINNWVARSTNDKIKIMAVPPLDPKLVSILANAVYFKAAWTFPFDTVYTRTDSFFTSTGEIVSADYMGLSSEEFQNENYRLDPDITFIDKPGEFMAFSMPYGDRWFRMSVFLPDSSSSIESFISEFTAEKWKLWRDEFHVDRFDARLPKFKFTFGAGLNSVLKAMGIESAFNPSTADFSNMISDAGIWIDKVIQKAFVQVDEKGTEAAAATNIISIDSLPPYINCNRPFVFIIWEKESGALLFMGKVAKPVWEE